MSNNLFDIQDIIYEMLKYSTYEDLLNMKLINKTFQKVYLNENLWLNRVEKDFVDLINLKKQEESWIEYYFKLKNKFYEEAKDVFESYVDYVRYLLDYLSQNNDCESAIKDVLMYRSFDKYDLMDIIDLGDHPIYINGYEYSLEKYIDENPNWWEKMINNLSKSIYYKQITDTYLLNMLNEYIDKY